MSSWGNTDFRQLEDLCKRLGKLSERDIDRTCRAIGQQSAAILLNKAKKRTPVGHIPSFDEPRSVTAKSAGGKKRSFLSKSGAIRAAYWQGYRGGTLRDAWKTLPAVYKGDHYVFVVMNPTKYASYVEFGHRQQPGRYVPALGKRLKISWVKGRYMLTTSEEELKLAMPKIVQKELDKALKGGFDGHQ